MRILLTGFLAYLLFILACSSNHEIANAAPTQTYQEFKDSIQVLVPKLALEERKKLLFNAVFTSIPQHWQRTEWDFNGTTRTPKSGKIACGYFVTNTLSDLGFKINRVKLAQVASSQMIKELCVQTKWITGYDALKKYLEQQSGSAIYIVGLDFHTGYIIKSESNLYFLHSNYIQASGVILEKIESSEALQASKAFYIGNLSANSTLLNNWGK